MEFDEIAQQFKESFERLKLPPGDPQHVADKQMVVNAMRELSEELLQKLVAQESDKDILQFFVKECASQISPVTLQQLGTIPFPILNLWVIGVVKEVRRVLGK